MPRRPRKHARKKVKLNVKKDKKKIIFEDPEIRKRWDKDKTPRQNYLNLGLKMDPNDKDAPVENPIVFNLPEPVERPKRQKMKMLERSYYRSLIEKHGTNFKAMERDIKLNFYQLSETRLEKRARLYLQNYGQPKEEKKRKHEKINQKAGEEEEQKGEEEDEDEEEENSESVEGEEDENGEADRA